MADAARKSTGAKASQGDRAAWTLLDATFSISAFERRRLVGDAIACDTRLKAFAEQWRREREGGRGRDVVDAVAADLYSFLTSLTPSALAERRNRASGSPPFDEAWRARFASIGARLAENEALSQRFADELAAAKIAALKEFAYGAGHEINNPLANISARAQTLLRDELHGERRRALATINRQAMRAHEMIADLMLFARPPRLDVSQVDAAELTRRVVDELQPLAEAQATQLFTRTPDEPLVAAVDGTQLAVAIKAVVRNALEAVAAGGNVEVTARMADVSAERDVLHDRDATENANRQVAECPLASSEPPRLLEFTVRDDGPGFSERERAHLFDPFFSGREAGRGLGFGLCLAWRIVTDHGGQIAIASEPNRGATVTLSVPAGSPASPK